jgi:hypothetical protein
VQFLSRHGWFFKAVNTIANMGVILLIFSSSTFLSVLGLILLVLSILAGPRNYSSQVMWSLVGALLLVEALIFAKLYVEFPDRYPNEVVAYTDELVNLSQDGRIDEAFDRSNAAYGDLPKLGFEVEAQKIPDKLEFQALEYLGDRPGHTVEYVVFYLGPNEQVLFGVRPVDDDPKSFWLKWLSVRPLHKAREPIKTYWMRGDRYLKR